MMYYPIFNPRTDIDACVRSETLQDFAKVEVHGARARLKSALEHLRASTSRRSKAVSKYEQQRREPQLAARAWSFIDPKGQESDGFSLVELLPLAKSVPTLRINNSLQELSLRLVDALNLQKGFLRAVGERKAAEAAEEEAEERVKEAKAKVAAAEARYEAARACIHYAKLAKCRWAFQSQVYTPSELKEVVKGSEEDNVYDIDSFAPSIPAQQAVKEWVEAWDSAKSKATASMDLAGVRVLGAFTIDSDCWQVSMEEDKHLGPYSLRDLRAWAETQEVSPYKSIFHVDHPDVVLPLCHVCYYKELDSLVFGNDPQGEPVPLGGGEEIPGGGHDNKQATPFNLVAREAEPSSGPEELKDVKNNGVKALVQRTTEPPDIRNESQPATKDADSIESFDTIKKFITSLPTPKKRAGTMPFGTKKRVEPPPSQGPAVKVEAGKAGLKPVDSSCHQNRPDAPSELHDVQVKRPRVKEDTQPCGADSNPS